MFNGIHRQASVAAAALMLTILSANCDRPVAQQPDKTPKISIESVDYAELDKAIAKHNGKLVVIDLWGDWCLPCKEKFPKFVELTKKYSAKDVTFMSLCLPIGGEKDLKETVAAFLKKQKATFPNYLLKDHENWGEKFDTSGAPAVRIYGRDGKLVQQFSPGEPNLDWTLKDVEKRVEKLLKNK